jgi:ribosome-associated protein
MAEKRANTSRRSRSISRVKSAAKTAARPVARKAANTSNRAAGKAPAKKLTMPRRADKPKIAAGVADVVKVVEGALDEMKAVQVRILDVRKLTDIADTLIIASGTSDRHVRSIADRVLEHAKKAGFRPMGVEGQRDGEWVLVDLQDVVVHIMLPRVRELYRLESLWDVSVARRDAAVGE